VEGEPFLITEEMTSPLFSLPTSKSRSFGAGCALLVAAAMALTVLIQPVKAKETWDPSQTGDEIRAAASQRSSIGKGRALPLAATWNAGWTAEGFTPAFQLQAIHNGHHVLPTFYLPAPTGESKEGSYYEASIKDARRLGLPLTLKSTQWESLLLGDSESVVSSRACPPRGFTLTASKCLSPFGPMEAWERAGAEWGSTSMLRTLQRWYPEPPLVLFLSNNEAPKLPWSSLDRDPRYRSIGDEQDMMSERAIVADAWAERNRALQAGFRKELNPSWSMNAIFVGYNAFGPGFVGRWSGWADRSLGTKDHMPAEASGWDGASVPFYVSMGDPSSDHTVWSPQIAAMNWVSMLEEIERRSAGFWFEISTWDGAAPGDARGKPALYRQSGQATPPSRYRGMVQFGMWLLRPRVVREYRGYLERRTEVGSLFDEIVQAVDLVYSNPKLKKFWRYGRLVANTTHEHPYRAGLPAWLARSRRWFLLDTSVDPPRPWTLSTELEVFSIALVMGETGSRRWLVYAHSPLADREEVKIDIPEFRCVTMPVNVAGTFAVVDERSGRIRELRT
jgi:hypothetical protein